MHLYPSAFTCVYLPFFLILRVREQRPTEGKGIAQGHTELGLQPKLLTPASTPTDVPRTSLKRPCAQATIPQGVGMAGRCQAWSFRRGASYFSPSTSRGPELTVRADVLRGLAWPQGKGLLIVVLRRRPVWQRWRQVCCLEGEGGGM